MRRNEIVISIIIPIYNAKLYLAHCIDSILQQTFCDYEVLLIDDGSTDGSSKICDEYALIDTRVKVIHKENGGSASARNVGLMNVSGEYIVFVDADDCLHKEYLRLLYEKICSSGADIVQCNYCIVEDYSKLDTTQEEHSENIYSNIEFLDKFCDSKDYLKIVVLWNKIYKKALFEDLFFPEGKGVDDDYLICQILYRAKKIITISDTLYYYYMSPGSQMRSAPSLKRLDGIDAVKSQLAFLEEVNEMHLYNKLLYRYYAVVIDGYYYALKHFPNEKELIRELKKERKKSRKVYFLNEVSFRNKVILFVRNRLPFIFRMLHGSER